jgi:hypothetical protein
MKINGKRKRHLAELSQKLSRRAFRGIGMDLPKTPSELFEKTSPYFFFQSFDGGFKSDV